MGQGTLVINHGDGAAPYVIGSAFPDSSSKIVEMVLAMRSNEGQTGNKSLVDLVNSTGWSDLAADARGWDVTHENDTSSVSDTANGSVGNAAKILGTSTNVGVMLRRVRVTRTTLLDSLRGREYVLLRLRTSAASRWEVQLRWSQSLAEPATVSNLAVTHDTTLATSFGYVELPLGFIEIPEDPNATLVGIALEVWARRLSGTGDLFMDFVRLLPATPGKDVLTKVMVPPGGSESILGQSLTTPVANPASGTAGTPTTPPSVPGLRMGETTDNAGWGPNAGTVLAVGRHRYVFTVYLEGTSSPGVIFNFRIRNVTDSNDAVTGSLQYPANEGHYSLTKILEFDAVAGKAYQPQVYNVNWAGANAGGIVVQIDHEFIPSTGQNETLRADPSRNTVEKLGFDGGHFLTAEVKGPVPFWIPPGLAAVFVVPFDVPKAGYNEPESVKSRTLTLSATGAPRYYQ